ncbi:MAG: hypothetical protein ACE5GW_14085, partial [Planctomycetota bacterium]
LYQKIPRDWVLPLHAYLTEHARSVCVPEEGRMDCPGCVLKRGCPYPKKVPARRSSASRRAR